ncbi:extra-large guanine nucleotide-binding protein 1-like isoform X1 [Gastrolobium bilobum]|uniref:extra-large guanine nucleotide-binding protein 1-like isoform X1 n=1 Tax=Gastrolobium bilobum TaxID=150636 RepID=UPI002AAFB146|nr:extra-large guanine nucleotide-binding protein 1-like isoform X1 [Gastrolobium bilobum]
MSPVADDGSLYSFAVEYDGPPLGYDLPRAVPISVDDIPVAAVVSQVPLSDTLSLPVVQPLLPPQHHHHHHNHNVKELRTLGSGPRVSKELELASERTVSPTSVIAFENRASQSNVCELSGELSSSGGFEFELSNGNDGSGEFSDVVGDSSSCRMGMLEESSSRELPEGPRIGAGTGTETRSISSSNVEFWDKSGRSSSGALRVSSGGKGSLDFNELNQQDWGSNESVLSLEYPSTRVSSLKAEDCDARRPPLVTFNVDSDDALDEGFDMEDTVTRPVKREPLTKGKKGSCYRCFKGNRFTEKEVCLVCDAKYCSNCVLRAMGSMPEGRKCVTCIGFPIDESKRANLGKFSWMLKRLLNDLEVRQIMKAEKFCEVNQLPPEYICVNGKPLSYEELITLQNCPNPPKKLKPGNYWYDKVSGLWGKEGQKPSRIISPHLNVGGPVQPDASNGNTQIFINGREITKVELRMLQLAGVQCAGNPHFWVNEDGSYQEEGQKNTRGYIWGKAGTKLVCAFLSLPVPSKSSSSCGEQHSNLASRTNPDYLEHGIVQKLLLVGCSGSGTSTIFKQAKMLYKSIPFSEDEHENIKSTIQSNVYAYLGILLEGRERFEDESLGDLKKRQYSVLDTTGTSPKLDDKTIYSIGPRLKAFSDWLLKTMVAGKLDAIFPAATREYAPLIEELWNDAAIKATYERRSELEMLPSVASYFLERAVKILRTDYEPSDLDILYAEGVTSSNGLACVEFSFPQSATKETVDSADRHDSMVRYQLIRVHARGQGENCKWLEMFEDVEMVIFCVALSDYDQFSVDGNGCLTNKMTLSMKFFETIVTHPTFEQMDFLLILNKFDQFEEKIEQVPLTKCDWFSDFHPMISRSGTNSNSNSINNNPSLGQLASHYIGVKFKKLYSSLTGRKLYVSLVKGLEPRSVDAALKYAKEILKWNEERPNFSLSEYSMYSTEGSSFSH